MTNSSKPVFTLSIFIVSLFLMKCTNFSENKISDKSLIVHYVANEGFLLESNGKKVLIDALFNTGLDRYAEPDSTLLTEMILGKPPFNNIDYLLFTHNHPDHFNDSLTYAFMNSNTRAAMLCPDQVYEQLRNSYPLNPEIDRRILAITPDSGQVITRNIDKVIFTACRTRHGDTYDIENNAYVIDFGGVKVFHSGDSWKESLNDWQNLDIKSEHVDLALVNGFYAGDKYKLLNEKMLPKQIILIHMKNEHLDMFSDIMSKDTAVFRNSTLFKTALESKTYHF
jgi:L-ascorbate metabolism protein UlaG (beta-lactamase superfamily)